MRTIFRVKERFAGFGGGDLNFITRVDTINKEKWGVGSVVIQMLAALNFEQQSKSTQNSTPSICVCCVCKF